MAVFGVLGFLHRQQVAVHDADVAHAQAAHFQQKVGAGAEHAGFDRVSLLDVLGRQNGRARCHTADQGQHQLRHAGQGQAVALCHLLLLCALLNKLLSAMPVQRTQCVRLQTNAARGAADEFDGAFAGQRLQVFFGGVGRFETQLGGNFSACGRRAGVLNGGFDEIQNLLLAVGEFDGVHLEVLG